MNAFFCHLSCNSLTNVKDLNLGKKEVNSDKLFSSTECINDQVVSCSLKLLQS